MDNLIDKILTSPLVLAIISIIGPTGGVLWYKINKVKTAAEVRKLDSEINIDSSGQWEKLYNLMQDGKAKADKKIEDVEYKMRLITDNFYDLGVDYNKLKESYKKLEEKFNLITLDNEKKVGRITALEKDNELKGGQIIDLQHQLTEYKHLDVEKIDDAKAVLHNTVEEKLESIKQ